MQLSGSEVVRVSSGIRQSRPFFTPLNNGSIVLLYKLANQRVNNLAGKKWPNEQFLRDL